MLGVFVMVCFVGFVLILCWLSFGMIGRWGIEKFDFYLFFVFENMWGEVSIVVNLFLLIVGWKLEVGSWINYILIRLEEI